LTFLDIPKSATFNRPPSCVSTMFDGFLQVSGSGFRVKGVGFRISGFGFRVSGFRVSCFILRVQGSGFMGQGNVGRFPAKTKSTAHAKAAAFGQL